MIITIIYLSYKLKKKEYSNENTKFYTTKLINFKDIFPGLVVCVLIGLISKYLGTFVPHPWWGNHCYLTWAIIRKYTFN